MSTRIPPPVAFVSQHEATLVDDALALIGMDTENPPGRTVAAIDWLEDRFAGLGAETDRIATDPAKPNLVATLPGERDTTLLYVGHVDTVPFDRSTWEHDPLGEVVGDRLYGRGATDMKGAVAAMLLTARAYAETGTTPPVTLGFAFVSDEETAGHAGLPAVLDRGLEAEACVIGETTCEAGRHSVAVADRGSVWLSLEATGVAAHGSRPMLGENAIDRLYAAITALRTEFADRALSMDPAVERIVEESVAYYAPTLGEAVARRLFEYPTINLGTIEGGTAINAVPESARAEIDVRVAPGVDTRDVIADVRACVATCPGVTVADVSWSVGTYESLDEPIVVATRDVAGSVVGERIYARSATGGGDAKRLRHAGIPTVEFALGTETAHAPDEYVTTGALVDDATIYTRLPYAFATRC